MSSSIQGTSENAIVLEIDDRGIATITLNRPEKHNAFDDHIILALRSAFLELKHDKTVRALVLTGNGKSFSAGADLEWMQTMATYSKEDNYKDAQVLANMLFELNHLPFPTIAKVNGAAFGGAIGLISGCDIAIATDKASFALSEVKIGLIPATISPYVIQAIGQRAARRYFLTAERFSADTAFHLGLISEVVRPDNIDDSIDSLVSSILANGPTAIHQAKQLIFDINQSEINETLINKTSQLIANIRASDEGKEGLNAFLEKRSPRWVEE